MKIINPSVELYPQEDYTLEGIYKQIEKCAKVSYKSEDKITETSSKAFVDNLIKAEHYAPLEFGTVYLIITLPKKAWNKTVVDKYYKNPYSRCFNTYNDLDYIYYITTNYRVLLENGWLDDLKYLSESTEYHHKRYCVKFTTDIGVAREFTRHKILCVA